MRPPLRDLTLYLLRPGVSAAEAIEHSEPLRTLDVAVGALQAKLYVKPGRPRPPRWAAFFAAQIEPATFGAVGSASAALVVEAVDRVWAVVFGYGLSLLRRDCWVEDFGLRVALNTIDRGKVRSVDKQTLDELGRHARIQASREATVSEFGIDVERDLLKAVTGRLTGNAIGEALTGKDALRVTSRVDLQTMPSLLRRCLEASQSRRYRREYPWMEQIQTVRDRALNHKLADSLVRRIQAGQTESIELAAPAILDWSVVSLFRYRGLRDKCERYELALADLLELMRQRGREFERSTLDRVAIEVVDSDGFGRHQWNLGKCIHGSLTMAGASYVLSAGLWYRVNSDFVAEVDQACAQLPKVRPGLPVFTDECEKDYCVRVAGADSKWARMDRRTLPYGGGRSKVEFCDLFASRTKQIVHIKRYAGSAPLSHLFAQALVSGEAFRVDQRFREELNQLLPKPHRLRSTRSIPNGYEIVLGIVHREGLNLPFFARVSLRQAARRLMGFGYRVSIGHVDVAPEIARKKRVRSRKKEG